MADIKINFVPLLGGNVVGHAYVKFEYSGGGIQEIHGMPEGTFMPGGVYAAIGDWTNIAIEERGPSVNFERYNKESGNSITLASNVPDNLAELVFAASLFYSSSKWGGAQYEVPLIDHAWSDAQNSNAVASDTAGTVVALLQAAGIQTSNLPSEFDLGNGVHLPGFGNDGTSIIPGNWLTGLIGLTLSPLRNALDRKVGRLEQPSEDMIRKNGGLELDYFANIFKSLTDAGSGGSLSTIEQHLVDIRVETTDIVNRAIRDASRDRDDQGRIVVEPGTDTVKPNDGIDDIYTGDGVDDDGDGNADEHEIEDTGTYADGSSTPMTEEHDPNDPRGNMWGPVILDLDGDGIDVSFGGQATFDIDGDGFREQTAWAAADDGFLVVDLDADGNISASGGDGDITQGAEIAFASWAGEGATDLQGLAQARDDEGRLIFDSNGDGVLDNNDDVWNSMKVFQDLDQDGEVDEGELRTLDDWGISQINLTYDDGSGFAETDDNVTILGNTLHGTASFVRDGKLVEGGVGDVSLAYNEFGWRRVETDTGYRIEFESGDGWTFWDGETATDANADLAAGGYAGAYGDDRNNTLDGSALTEDAIIDGGAGHDQLLGGAGGDLLSGGTGRDTIHGGAGNDVVFADAEDNVGSGNVSGGEGYDQLNLSDDVVLDISNIADFGFEAVEAGDQNDRIHGDDGDSGFYFSGNGGNDTLTSAGGADILVGGMSVVK